MVSHMKIQPGRKRDNPLQLDLFSWEHPAVGLLPLPYAASVLSRRFLLSPQLARLVAEAVGFDVTAATEVRP